MFSLINLLMITCFLFSETLHTIFTSVNAFCVQPTFTSGPRLFYAQNGSGSSNHYCFLFLYAFSNSLWAPKTVYIFHMVLHTPWVSAPIPLTAISRDWPPSPADVCLDMAPCASRAPRTYGTGLWPMCPVISPSGSNTGSVLGKLWLQISLSQEKPYLLEHMPHKLEAGKFWEVCHVERFGRNVKNQTVGVSMTNFGQQQYW